ncbi:MAG: hypothetical protein HC888_19720 [Candidatus Competibacteraceae bacterium]|nr:hypothetical protein [Candidatus Competibacteraceae bacterium]
MFGKPINSIRLPDEASIDWTWDRLEMPSISQCGPDSQGLGVYQDSISRRVFKDRAANILATTHYLRSTYHGAGLPTANGSSRGYCSSAGGLLITPHAEMVVASLNSYAAGRSRVELNYFSVWPFPAHVTNDGTGGQLWTAAQAAQWGWQGEDFGQPFTRNQAHSTTGAYLSKEVYDCATTAPGSVTDPKQLVSNCTRKQSTFVLREGIQQQVPSCSTCNSPASAELDAARFSGLAQTKTRVTVFHDDDNRTISDTGHNNDGFGNYRTTVSSGDVGPDQGRETKIDYNATRGTLHLTAGGAIAGRP